MGCYVLKYSANSVRMLLMGQSLPPRQLPDMSLKAVLMRWKLSCISVYRTD
jgi:hypothetical protein